MNLRSDSVNLGANVFNATVASPMAATKPTTAAIQGARGEASMGANIARIRGMIPIEVAADVASAPA